ncbi:tRNA lysidine(34) synthetase TilS [Phaeovulum vinaykumarii]|uniref:tRNA(Ile)-lysidine synthase n=1 Tax=Phaeovulum vinaykumarii TaxID=407234 RepID=A0A1N7K454_9RHOB|nr:tRNA lysidine(34) synthetase TilS [Phaeovulum vinaykumarii]SIS56234.1 tRNA(Ile)-lysidine synthase [Phaeovulum vinaykumarii]SOB92769.1 tRNA(Ile)-lysidine synthase [Phaeovulum vinaykumarii]
MSASATDPHAGALDRVEAAADAAFSLPEGAGGRRLAVAVSGGGDSMAALHLLAARHPVRAVTLDHGLRPEAAAEAAQVARACADLGVPHTVLRWTDRPAGGNLMDAARRARLRLIGAWACAEGVTDVVLAHTADDQAETFLMRLGREAGLAGLAGMRPSWHEAGVRWHRPFLGVTRADLRIWARAQGIAWAEDPTNDNPAYLRARARRALRDLAPLGLRAEGLAAVVAHLSEAEEVVRAAARGAMAALAQVAAGDLVFDAAGFDAQPMEIRRRLMRAALAFVGAAHAAGPGYPPRARALAALLAPAEFDRTLAGCRIRRAGGRLRVAREFRAVADLVAPGPVWDRWRIAGAPLPPGATIRALGPAGLARLPDWRVGGLPRPSALASPGIWQADRLLAAPLLAPGGPWRAELLHPDPAHFLFPH